MFMAAGLFIMSFLLTLNRTWSAGKRMTNPVESLAQRNCAGPSGIAWGARTRSGLSQQGEDGGEEVPEHVEELFWGHVIVGVLGQALDPMLLWFAYSRIPWNRVLPSVETLVARAAASSVNGGTGRGWGTGQVAGSRGVSRVKAWENVRAAASRAVNGSPRPQGSRSVAISEVCRCSWLSTSPSATHGDTMTAGTR
jgi:hypothetical protein